MSGRLTTRSVRAGLRRTCAWVLLATASLPLWAGSCPAPEPGAAASKTVYLTFDTGHMDVAPLIAEVLKKHDVRVTFFAAHERTMTGNGSLGSDWANWWKARASEGHEFASHTHDHTYWRADLPQAGQSAQAPQEARFRVRASAGPMKDAEQVWTAAQYCADIAKADLRLQALTGKTPLPLFRAPGGKTSPALLAAARGCGYAHVAWAPAGFLGDELPSQTYPNAQLLEKALKTIQAGDILVAHLGIWSRQEPWAPAVLEPLLVGLKARGFCFATLREHPRYLRWIKQHETPPSPTGRTPSTASPALVADRKTS